MRRPPFIWTPAQPVNQAGFIATMHGTPPRDDGVNRWFLFRHRFIASGDNANVKITCDGRYQFFINGVRVGRGPVRSSAMAQKYDCYDLAPLLRDGENVATVIVHMLGVDTAWHEAVKGMWHPTFGHGGLWFDGAIQTGAGWKVIESDAWDSSTERMNASLGFIESFDANKLPENWHDATFDDSAWLDARALHVDGGGPDQFFGGMDTTPFPILLPNPLQPLHEEARRPESCAYRGVVAVKDDLPVHRQLYEEPFVEATPAASHLGRVVTHEGQGVTMLLKFDTLLTGYSFIEIDAQGGEQIDIAVAERLPGEYGGEDTAEPRIVRKPLLGHDAHLARYTARPGRQRFERFEWSATRWMQITIRNAAAGIDILDVGCVHTHYPVQDMGRFECDDPFINRLWSLGRDTLKLCMHDGWQDCPSREQRQWLGDVTVEHSAGQAAFGPSANALTAKYLRDVADSQRPDGLTQMFAPGDHKVNGLLIPDWTLQWILTAGDYYRYTGDLETIEAIFPAVQRALAWFETLRTSRGLIADLPYWHFMDWSAVGRKGEAATLNAQLAGALAVAAELAEVLENGRAARKYSAAVAEIIASLNARHWDEHRGVYVDCVDPVTNAQDARVSQHANAAMILWGGAPRDRWDRIIARITDPARLTFTAAPPIVPTGELLDLEQGVVLANTFYGHFVYSALGAANRADLAIALMRERFGPMLAAGATTLWESFGPTASLCHGFSASPTYQLITQVLGVTPIQPGFARMRFDPQMGGLRQAAGAIETVSGRVEVSIAAVHNMMEVTLILPDGIDAEVGFDRQVLKGGQIHSFALPSQPVRHH
jgi:alpha-L-rhamnosidase